MIWCSDHLTVPPKYRESRDRPTLPGDPVVRHCSTFGSLNPMSQLLVKERRVVLKEKNQIGDKGSIIAGFTRWIWGGEQA